MTNTEVNVTLRDIDDVRQSLGVCLNYFTALDLAESHRHLAASHRSAITLELERLKGRFDGYMADHLLQIHEAEMEEEEELEEELEEEPELAAEPLGRFEAPKQEGRRVSVEELRERTEPEAEPEGE